MSRLPIGVGQTINRPGPRNSALLPLPPTRRARVRQRRSCPPRAKLRRDDPHLVTRGRQRALGIAARAGSSIISPAAITPPPITTICGLKMLTRFAIAIPRFGPISSITSLAAGSPSCASSVTSGPTSSRPPPSPGRVRSGRSSAIGAPRARAPCRTRETQSIPDSGSCRRSSGRQRRSPCGRARRRRRSAPRYSSPFRISPPQMPVPSVSITTSLTPRAAPPRCSATTARFPSLSTNTGSPSRSAITSANAMFSSGRCTNDGDPRPLVERARDSEADGADLGTGRLTRLLHGIDGDVEEGGLVETAQQSLGTVMDPEADIDRSCEQFGPAHVDADCAPRGHESSLYESRMSDDPDNRAQSDDPAYRVYGGRESSRSAEGNSAHTPFTGPGPADCLRVCAERRTPSCRATAASLATGGAGVSADEPVLRPRAGGRSPGACSSTSRLPSSVGCCCRWSCFSSAPRSSRARLTPRRPPR